MTTSQLGVEMFPRAQRFTLDDRRLRVRAFRLFLLLEMLFLGFPYLSQHDIYDVFSALGLVNFISISVIFIVLPFIVFWKSKIHSYVVFIDNYIEFPRWFFGVRKIEVASISSFEEMKIMGKEFGVLIGLLTGGVISYDAKEFRTEAEYQRFKSLMRRILLLNSYSLRGKGIEVRPIDWRQNALLLIVLGLWVTVFLQLFNNEELGFYEALDIGVLTKNVLSGEDIYRVPASFFLHINSFHISMNIASFALFGQFLLRIVDHYRFLCIFLISAFLASLITLTLSPYGAVIGASGGIMGVFGAYCCLKFLRHLPGSISSSSNIWILFFIAVQVGLEYFVEGIDSYTHAGGFVTGFVYMWFCIRNEREHSVFQSSAFEKITASVLTLGYLGGLLVFLSKVYG